MTTQQLNRILFWIITAILGLIVLLMYAAGKFGRRLAKEAQAKRSAKSAKKIKASKGKEAK